MPLNLTILPLVFLSGLAALVHEILWLRLFSLTFGNTAQAGAVVLGAFMGGMALGAWFFGRRAETSPRPYRLYAWLELGVAASAALLLAGYLAADSLYAAVFRLTGQDSWTLGVCRVLISFGLMIAPCALMGGTLPVLVRAAAPAPDASGRRAGALYAVNTFGAVAGVLTAGLITIRWWGVWPTAFAAVGVNVLVGAAALALSAREARGRPEAEGALEAAAGDRRLALVLAAAVGGYSLALEVLYSRIVVFAVTHTIYIWTVILAVYLAGIAVGSAATARVSQRRPAPLAAAARCLIGMAVAAWAYLACIAWLTRKLFAFNSDSGDWGLAHSIEIQMAFAALTIFPLALLSGAAFPFLVRGYVGPSRAAGRGAGALYAVNTAAGVVGSLAAGFALLPTIGAQWSLFGLTALFFLVVGGVLLRSTPRRLGAATWLCGGAIAALVAAVAPSPRLLGDLLVMRFPSAFRVLMSREDVAATVSVIQQGGVRLVTVNDAPVAGSGSNLLRNSQILQGFFPLAAHPNPRRIAMIGFGSGETADILAKAGPEVFDLAELCPGIFAAAPFFHDINFEIERAALPRQLIMDGKNYLKLTAQQYDVVTNDCVHPAFLGNASLYGRDHFAAARRALADDGVMTSWLPLVGLTPASFGSIVRTFAAVYPNCGIVYAPTHVNSHAMLLGKKQPGPLMSLARIQTLLTRDDLKTRLKQIDVDDPLDLVNFLVLGPQAVAATFGGAPLHTDGRPILDFEAGRTSPQDVACFWRNAASLAGAREDPWPYIDLTGAADVELLLAAQPMRRRATEVMLRVIGDNEMPPGRAAVLIDEAAALSPGLAGVTWLKNDLEEWQTRRARPAPMVVGSRRRERQADAFVRAGEFDRAVATLETELHKNPANFQARARLGRALVLRGDLVGGAQQYEQALRQHPGDVTALGRLGEIAMRRGRWAEAEARFREALEQWGPRPDLYADLAQVRTAVGDAIGAMGWLREGLRRFSNDYSLLLAYAEAARQAGLTEEAAQALQRAAELNPGDPRISQLQRQASAPPPF